MLQSLPPFLSWGLVLVGVALLSDRVVRDGLWLRRSGASRLGLLAGVASEAVMPLAVVAAFVLALPAALLPALPAFAAMIEPSWPMRLSWGRSRYLEVLWVVLEIDRAAAAKSPDLASVERAQQRLEGLRDPKVVGLIDLTRQQVELLAKGGWDPNDPSCSALAGRIHEDLIALYGERSARLLRTSLHGERPL